ncbi:MAG: hypothetical protein JXB39_01650 [Deltaproteobacteria bacterium]|nr:hypothetical protein [Deltaproteobacteria bacterium]
MEPGRSRPHAAVVDARAHRRLALLDRLRAEFEPDGYPPGPEIHRTLRARHPDLVVLVAAPSALEGTFRLCRWLKTDLKPVERVVIVNMDGVHRDPAGVLGDVLADGYWEGGGTAEEIAAFVREAWLGRRPVAVRPRRALLARILGR